MSCPEDDGDQSCGYQSQVLVPAQPEFRSTPLGTNRALQAYAHQLACVEHELEHFLSEELLECFSGSPAVAMDVQRSLWLLIKAWELLDGSLSNGESQGTNGPFEQQLLYQHSSVEIREPRLSTLVLLSSIGAICVFVFYVIRCLCLRRNQCAQELDERGERCWEGRLGTQQMQG